LDLRPPPARGPRGARSGRAGPRAQAVQAKDVRRLCARVEHHEIPSALPAVARVAEKVVDLVALVVREAELAGRDVDPTGLRIVWVEIDDDEHDVLEVARRLRIEEELVVVDTVEADALVAEQRGLGAADLVQAADQRS